MYPSVKSSYLFLAICLFTLSSCLDEINLDIPKGTENGLVIRGEIVAGTPAVVTIRISRIFNFNLISLSPASAKSVKLIDEAGNEMEIGSKSIGTFRHVFEASDPIQVEVGGKYKIRVVSFDDRTFESSFEELQAAFVEKGTLKAERAMFQVNDAQGGIIETPAVQFSIDTPIKLENSTENGRFFWQTERTYRITDSAALPDFVSKTCYISVNLDFNNIHLLDATLLSTESTANYNLSKVILNHEFAEGYYYNVYQRSLTKGAFEYWNQTKQVIERTGGLFDSPAGRIISNIQNIEDPADEIFGYFTAYTEDTIRLYVPPAQFDFPLKQCPLPPSPLGPCPEPPPTCCDCLLADRSQLERPDFWIE